MSKSEALASLARQVVERVQDDALTPVTLSVEHAADLLESLRKPKPWERCGIHGPAEDRVWACPACLVELRTEAEALRADAERWRYVVTHAGWYRRDDGQVRHSQMCVRLPYEADQSCVATRTAAIDAARSKT